MKLVKLIAVLALAGTGFEAGAQTCDQTYYKSYFGKAPVCYCWPKVDSPCWIGEYYYCGTNQRTAQPAGLSCTWDGGQAVCKYAGCGIDPTLLCCGESDTSSSCPQAPRAPEICGDGANQDCNGHIDEGCCPGGKCPAPGGSSSQPDCNGAAGDDPIILSSRASVTEPFTDFAVEHVTKLSLTRMYASNDVSIVKGTSSVLGHGWHHDWEAQLTCASGICTVMRGLAPAMQFAKAGSAASGDGTETWDVYKPRAIQGVTSHHGLLARRPTGTWILFLENGQELQFATVCDACSSADATSPRCKAPESGGIARLVRLVDGAGNGVAVTYDRPGGVFLGLRDDLGHALELRADDACSAGLARELRYDGSAVARYAYSGLDLRSATDADGSVLRSYVYHAGSGGRLQAVLNEAGQAIAEFQYDTSWQATGVADMRSSVAVSYGANGSVTVTEQFHGANGVSSSTSVRTLNVFGRVSSVSDGCACGPAKNVTWTPAGELTCSMDTLGHVTTQELDAVGRVARRVEYGGSTCTPPSPLPPDAREERRGYGLTRSIATGYVLDLDTVTRSVRSSALTGTACLLTNPLLFDPISDPSGQANCIGELYDHDTAPKAIDPPGYVCAPSGLRPNSVICRELSVGYVTGASGPMRERHATFYSYDAQGRVVRAYGPVNLDLPGASDVAPVEERTYWDETAELSNRGRLHEVKRYPSSAGTPLVTTYEHDAFGVYRVTAPDGLITTTVKDGRGRPRYTLSARGGASLRTTETRYHDGLSPRLQLLPNGAAVRSTYDTKGRLETVEHLSGDPDATGAPPTLAWSEHHSYDEAGNGIHSERRDALGTLTWQQDREFDVQHRVVRETNPEAPSLAQTWSYDGAGFLASRADEEGRGTSFTPDPLDRPARIRRTSLDTAGNAVGLDVATYAYRPRADTLASVKDGSGATTTYVHDDFGRLERLSSPTLSKGGDVTFGYDARGNVLARTYAGVEASYTYDGLDRVLSMAARDSASGASLQYTYRYDEADDAGLGTGIGRLTSIDEPERTLTFGYDALGQLATETVAEVGVQPALVTQYAYDALGRLETLTYPSGLVVHYERDIASGEVVRVVDVTTGKAYASNVTHYPGGPLSALTFGNGRTLTHIFDLRYQARAVDTTRIIAERERVGRRLDHDGSLRNAERLPPRRGKAFLVRLPRPADGIPGAPRLRVRRSGEPHGGHRGRRHRVVHVQWRSREGALGRRQADARVRLRRPRERLRDRGVRRRRSGGHCRRVPAPRSARAARPVRRHRARRRRP